MTPKLPTLVSVVVPIYNMQRYLADTIESILASDYEHFEVILMDDGSSDDSLKIAREYAEKDSRIRVFSQTNAGVSAARNRAISLAQGRYILPVDADDLLTPAYIRLAAAHLDQHPQVKVVACEVAYIGEKSGKARMAPFSLRRLARKNMIHITAMYRKSDWEACGGYAAHGREDWAFWIAMFKQGGEFYRLPMLGFYYRIHHGSRRFATKKGKHRLVDELNALHIEWFEEMLHGPLRHQRSWSLFLNICHRCLHPRKWSLHPAAYSAGKALKLWVKTLPRQFQYNQGEIIYQGRNELRKFRIEGNDYVVKSFQKPHWVNRLVYGVFRKSKAQRSYEYAEKLLQLGIKTPQPIAFYQERCGLCFDKSYYVSLASTKTIHFKDMAQLNPDEQEKFLTAVGQLTAKLHHAGIYHKDYSGGNILASFEKDEAGLTQKVELELLDLNRMRFGKVSLEQGCANFDRFHVDEDQLCIMARAYAQARHFDASTCEARVLHYHRLTHSEKS